MGSQIIQCNTCATSDQHTQFNPSTLKIKNSQCQIPTSSTIPAPLRKEVQITYNMLIKQSNKTLIQEPIKGSSILELKEADTMTYVYEGQRGVYIGQTVHGKANGYGKVIFENGRYLEGKFKQGIINCQDGIVIQKNGDYYRGQIQNGIFSGKGQRLRQNLHKSRGTFKNNILEGKGERLYIQDCSVYRGYFQNDKREGKGRIDWSQNLYYEGMFQDDKIQGIGHLHTPKYDYWGPFQANKKQGKGTVKFIDGGKFEGYFQNDEPQGYGQLHKISGQVEKGNFKNLLI